MPNVSILDVEQVKSEGPYDLVIVSHVMEHLLDFDLLGFLNQQVRANGLLYLEVPDALGYASHPRLEFLYYFDRLHVNHFTPQALARIAAAFDFGYLSHYQYSFPYRDGNKYPALGMLLRKGMPPNAVHAADLLETAQQYISGEKDRAAEVARRIREYPGVLVWGSGDNFCRSVENGGPLADLPNLVLLDQNPREVILGPKAYRGIQPADGLRQYSWPVVITVSEGRREIEKKVLEVDPGRPVFAV